MISLKDKDVAKALDRRSHGREFVSPAIDFVSGIRNYLLFTSGIGYVTCERLLIQLSQPDPSDAFPQFEPNEPPEKGSRSFEFSPSEGITIIMACRDQTRAEAAKKTLLESLDAHIAKLRQSRGADFEHATTFRENVEIAIHRLDLSSIQSVFQFGEEVFQKCVHCFVH